MTSISPNPASIDFHDLFVRVYTLVVGLSFGLGAVILSGGRARFSGPSFKGPRDFAQWLPILPSYAWWGIMFLCFGSCLIVALGRNWAVHVLRFGIVVFLFLAVALGKSVIENPVAAATGVVAYAVIALLFAVLQDHLHQYGWRH